jgi:HAD superfamily hydrolase (TIGR01509 family)
MNLKGILFDMDGVLVDSEKFICEAATRMFAEHCVYVEPEDFLPFVGSGEDRYLGGVAQKYNFPFDLEQDKTRTYEIYGELVKGKLKPLNGVISFIETCRKKGLKLAVATSADKVKMLINLKEIGIPAETFDATINGLEVVNKKPDPEIFVNAATKLGLKPEECLVVEDAVNGVKAAKAAGCKCLGLTTSFSVEELSEADWIAKDLSNVPSEIFKDLKI